MTVKFQGKRTVGCVTYLVADRTDRPLWTTQDPLVIERIVAVDGERAYWVSDKSGNLLAVRGTDLQDPYGYYERAQ